MSSVFTSAAAKDAARLMAVVVLPTPPFWLTTAITRPILIVGRFQSHSQHNAIRTSKAMHIPVSGSLFCAKCVFVFHVEHLIVPEYAFQRPGHVFHMERSVSMAWLSRSRK